jgi:radical SAM protein with 4Fe4S-binding SPASM domain
VRQLFLREEAFGGVLAPIDEGLVRFLDALHFDCAVHVAEDNIDEPLVSSIAAKYRTSRDVVERAIGSVTRLLREDSLWNEENLPASFYAGVTARGCVPTLGYPLDLHWEVTRRCNQHCVHCYNESGRRAAHPSYTQLRAVIDEIGENTKLRSVVVSGGEPLVRRDIFDFLAAVREVSHRVCLSSNGTLINRDYAARLKTLVADVNISMDAGDASVYESFRGRQGTFTKCIDGIRNCVATSLPVIAQTTISRANIQGLHELGSLLADLGVTGWSLRFPFNSGRRIHNDQLFFRREEYTKQADLVDSLRDKFEGSFAIFAGGLTLDESFRRPFQVADNPDGLVPCAAGTVLASICADGTLTPCALFGGTGYRSAPVWNTSLAHEWASSPPLMQMRSIRLHDLSGCKRCANARTSCWTGCRAKAYQDFGTVLRRDPDCRYEFGIA